MIKPKELRYNIGSGLHQHLKIKEELTMAIINLNDYIVEELNQRKKEILIACRGSVKEVDFTSERGEITNVIEFEKDGEWYTLENPIETQTIEIYVLSVVNDEYIENNLTIFLDSNCLSKNYMLNAGLSLKAIEIIIDVIGRTKGVRQKLK